MFINFIVSKIRQNRIRRRMNTRGHSLVTFALVVRVRYNAPRNVTCVNSLICCKILHNIHQLQLKRAQSLGSVTPTEA